MLAANDRTWHNVTADLTAYRGSTIRLYFPVHQDAYGDPTSMQIDDVTLMVN